MPGTITNSFLNATWRDRLGGRWAISLPPYVWSTPFIVGLIPLASSEKFEDSATLLRLTVVSAIAWIAFGLVLYIGHRTFFRNRATKPVSPIATAILGMIAGFTQSLIHGDWFPAFGLKGSYSLSLVTNATIGSAVWILATANFMYFRHTFKALRDALLKQQSNLLAESDEWLKQVRLHREDLAQSVRIQLVQEWEQAREQIRKQLEQKSQNWREALSDFSLRSQETALSLTQSFETPTSKRTSLTDALSLVSSIPLIRIRGTIMMFLLLATLPLLRLVGAVAAALVLTSISIALGLSVIIGRFLIRKFPDQARLIYVALIITVAVIPLISISIHVSSAIGNSASIGLALLGGTVMAASFISFNFTALRTRLREDEIRRLQSENILLSALEDRRHQVDVETRVDFAGHLNATVQSAIKLATRAIDDGFTSGNIEAVNSGLAVLDAVYSNILGQYSADEVIDLRAQISDVVKLWSDQAIITWSLSMDDLDHEVTRRVLLLIKNSLSQLVANNLAGRIHVDISSKENQAHIVIDSNANQSWIENDQLTREVIDATTSSQWKVERIDMGSRLIATVG